MRTRSPRHATPPWTVVAPTAFTQLFTWHPAAPWLVIGILSLLAGFVVVALESRLPLAAVRRLPLTAGASSVR